MVGNLLDTETDPEPHGPVTFPFKIHEEKYKKMKDKWPHS